MSWCGEDKGLGQPDEYLAGHSQWEGGRCGTSSGVAKPIADQNEARGRDDGWPRTALVESIEGQGSGSNESEEETSA